MVGVTLHHDGCYFALQKMQLCTMMGASLRGAWVNIEGVNANKVYAIACCIAYWLNSMGYGLDFKNELKSLLVSYPQVDPAAMGFPENWISEPLWR